MFSLAGNARKDVCVPGSAQSTLELIWRNAVTFDLPCCIRCNGISTKIAELKSKSAAQGLAAAIYCDAFQNHSASDDSSVGVCVENPERMLELVSVPSGLRPGAETDVAGDGWRSVIQNLQPITVKLVEALIHNLVVSATY